MADILQSARAVGRGSLVSGMGNGVGSNRDDAVANRSADV
jgi:hypothetical protein